MKYTELWIAKDIDGWIKMAPSPMREKHLGALGMTIMRPENQIYLETAWPEEVDQTVYMKYLGEDFLIDLPLTTCVKLTDHQIEIINKAATL